ncbi:MAG: GTP-binding protein [Bernardetiaceae bacterium]|nr:GTP-binding protein [Bernardetiaceae bacterium]
MDILRIATAGSVDDGKSTLIGRLLYETQSVPQDKLAAIEQTSQRKGLGFTDLSLLTDGLTAEREQGITIDVAHIYFATPRRKYIVADTPGHFEYTRNMVTGASNARVSIILIDARKGVVEQTHRHFYIAALLRIPHVVVCVNKMDLVNFDQDRFSNIVIDFQAYAQALAFPGQSVGFIPVSSLLGHNVVERSAAMPWYEGPSLLQTLEQLEPAVGLAQAPARLAVQHVIRPMTDELPDYRGYTGRLASGHLQVGDEVVALPSGQTSRVASLARLGEPLAEAHPGQSITVTLTTDIDVSRGDWLAHPATAPAPRREVLAQVCWLDHQALRPGATYLLQHGTARVRAKVQDLAAVVDVQTLAETPQPGQLGLNQIGRVQLRLAQPLFADAYAENPATGAFILIDEFSHGTVGVGFVQ